MNKFTFLLILFTSWTTLSLAQLGGGEDCTTATVIPTGISSFTDNGSTAAANDDYNEECNFAVTGGFDVVYSYTPTANQEVSLTLCTGQTDYDTKMYVYENTCPTPGTGITGTQFACNDDGCDNAPIFPNAFVSALPGLIFTAGNTYYIVVDAYGTGGGNYTLDMSISTCAAPSDIILTPMMTAVTVGWTSNAAPISTLIEYGPAGFIPGTGTVVSTTNNPETITGLPAASSFDVYVRDVCGTMPGDTSGYVGPEFFNTSCGTIIAPYTESFEAGGVLNPCWVNELSDDLDWTVFTGATGSIDTGPSGAYTGSFYLYTEASGPPQGAQALLTTPPIDITALSIPSIRFYYHMWGADMGTLNLEVEAPSGSGNWTTVWSLSGDQGNAWSEAFVSLVPFAGSNTISARFTGVIGAGFTSDMAIDQFVVDEAPTCPNPSLLMVTGVTDVSASISWQTGGVATTADIEYGPQGFIPGTGTVVNTADNPYLLTGLTANTAYDVYVTEICGLGDESDQIGPVLFNTTCGSFSAPYFEDFEDGGVLDNCWTNETNDDFDWTPLSGATGSIDTGPTNAYSGAFYMYTETSGIPQGNEAFLTSPIVDISSLTTPSLLFYYHMWGADMGTMIVQMESPAGANNWTNIWLTSGDQGNFWLEGFASLASATGPTVRVRFVGVCGASFTSDMAVDDVLIDEAPPCPNPSFLLADNITGNEAEISWNPGGNAITTVIEYGPTGFTPGTGTTVNATSNPFTLTGLSENTSYDLYLYEDCGSGDISAQIGPIDVTTLCGIQIAPYLEDFEDNGLLDNCWRNDLNDDFDWTVFSGPTGSVNTGPQNAYSGDFYLYTESSGPASGAQAILQSPGVDISGLSNPELEFYYHMFGAGMGTLNVEIESPFGSGSWTNILSLTGDQGDMWQDTIISLSAFAGNTVRARFSGVMTGDFTSDMAIDDVFFREQPINDVGATSVFGPNQDGCGFSGSDTIKMTIFNYGANPQTIIKTYYSINNGPPVEEYFTETSNPNLTVEYTFNTLADFSAPGTYEVKAWTTLLNGMPDDNPLNDTTVYYVNSIPLVNNFPYTNDFESGNGGWIASGTNSSWEFGVPGGTTINSAASGVNAYVTNLTGPYNPGELSFLTSPCLDFSSLIQDPLFVFSINFDSESGFDEGWVEVSTDGGATYSKLGANGTGINWYNSFNDYWEGDGGFTGWVVAAHTLTGLAGVSDARIRFVFSSDGSVQFEGMGVDDIFMYVPANIDAAASNISIQSAATCYTGNEDVDVTIINSGLDTLDLAVNNLVVNLDVSGAGSQMANQVVGSGILFPGESVVVTFSNIDLSAFGTYTLTGTANLSGDMLAFNDVISTQIQTAISTPIVEDFEDGVIPGGWVTNGFVAPAGDHNNLSSVLAANVFGAAILEATTPVFGPIQTQEVLTFDYRFVDFFAGTTPTTLTSDYLEVQVSTDCGDNFTTVTVIDNSNHTPTLAMTNVTVDLTPFVGEGILVRFFSETAGSNNDMWVDIDNINIAVDCGDLVDGNDIISEEVSGEGNGSVLLGVFGDISDYTYQWDDANMQTSNPATNLATGSYTVTITETLTGCVTVTSVEVGFICPGDLDLSFNITPETETGSNDGAIDLSVNAGQAPFTYEWSNSSTDEDLTDISATGYSVTVTDANGCMDSEEVFVGLVDVTDISSLEKLNLFPNPASDLVVLDLEFSTFVTAKVEITNSLGQVVFVRQLENISNEKMEINTADYSSGVYLVKVSVDNQYSFKKLILSK